MIRLEFDYFHPSSWHVCPLRTSTTKNWMNFVHTRSLFPTTRSQTHPSHPTMFSRAAIIPTIAVMPTLSVAAGNESDYKCNTGNAYFCNQTPQAQMGLQYRASQACCLIHVGQNFSPITTLSCWSGSTPRLVYSEYFATVVPEYCD